MLIYKKILRQIYNRTYDNFKTANQVSYDNNFDVKR